MQQQTPLRKQWELEGRSTRGVWWRCHGGVFVWNRMLRLWSTAWMSQHARFSHQGFLCYCEKGRKKMKKQSNGNEGNSWNHSRAHSCPVMCFAWLHQWSKFAERRSKEVFIRFAAFAYISFSLVFIQWNQLSLMHDKCEEVEGVVWTLEGRKMQRWLSWKGAKIQGIAPDEQYFELPASESKTFSTFVYFTDAGYYSSRKVINLIPCVQLQTQECTPRIRTARRWHARRGQNTGFLLPLLDSCFTETWLHQSPAVAPGAEFIFFLLRGHLQVAGWIVGSLLVPSHQWLVLFVNQPGSCSVDVDRKQCSLVLSLVPP